ncbi:MFS transporter [Burkholderia gladioli]|uniref:MFS transporter n=1 Tax=Burkholderia gladioli TaxID=28095 RepID=UPI003D1EEECC
MLVVAVALAIVVPLVIFLLPERPADVQLRPYGEPEMRRARPSGEAESARHRLRGAVQRRAPSRLLAAVLQLLHLRRQHNGYIGSHLIAMCSDYGMSEVQGASLLAAMGIFDLIGTTASGWLSDRYDSRVLSVLVLRAARTVADLPAARLRHRLLRLPLFAVFYGLDWIATVPPTVRLATDIWGKERAPIVFGWIVAGHQLGAAFATLGAGLLRASLGTYTLASMISGGLCIVGALIVLRIGRGRTRSVPQAA